MRKKAEARETFAERRREEEKGEASHHILCKDSQVSMDQKMKKIVR